MLMDMRIDTWSDQRAIDGRLARWAGGDERNACRFHLHPDRAVLVEIPEEAIDIIADGRQARNHQPPRAPDAGLSPLQVAELPQYAEVLFMHADRIGNFSRPTVPVVAPGIEILHMA